MTTALKPAPFTKAIVLAARALAAGVANEGQQKAIFTWILRGPCHISESSFAGENSHATNFREGSRYVGLQIAALVDLDALALEHTIEATREKRTARKPKPRHEAKND